MSKAKPKSGVDVRGTATAWHLSAEVESRHVTGMMPRDEHWTPERVAKLVKSLERLSF